MKKTLIILKLVILTVSISSCSKWLDLQPQDGITKNEFWKTKEDVRAALFGIYSSLNSGGVEERIFLWGELRADMVGVTSYAIDDYRLVKNYNTLSTNQLADWSAMYTAINNCNLLIDFAPEAKAADPTFTDSEYNSYVGEALAVRSLLYFYLVRTFRDIPLKLKGSYKDTDVESVGQANAAQVLEQLINDLKRAQEMVPDYHVPPSGANLVINASNTGRITKPAVTTLLADVYLWNEEYDKAEAEANKVLVSNRYRLLGEASRAIFDGGTAETIFEISHKESIENPMYPLVVDPRRRYVAAVEIVNSDVFPPNTETDLDLTDSRGEGILYTSSGAIVKHGTETPDYFNFQIYRISDAMLIQAEAIAEQGRGAEALQILNTLRSARGALKSTERAVSETDTDGIVRYIIEEKARELSFEGKRWFDLLRLAKKDNYANLDVILEIVSKVVDASVQQSAIAKARDVDSHYLPILEDELFKDGQLQQNPFYLK
ncbi:RagB/SusD family nutrient uptake outer membrane protein [Sphingobacterium suaedae]|uniref:RagB/SusD family nutrient uptake outer membrane protein n=1 Tax=Sphingobacterium suaedae TaxID=1686402 RepID=A0ABW5KGJ9_9SPHI